MGNAVLIQNPDSVYKDQPGIRYHFPKIYLSRLEKCIGDWVVFYEGRRGAFGYTAVQKVLSIVPDPERDDHFFALLDRGTLWQFEQVVPRNSDENVAYEYNLRGADGRATSGGNAVSAVRSISLDEFSAIVSAGLRPLSGPFAIPRDAATRPQAGFAENQADFALNDTVDIRSKVLASRLARDQSFARLVKSAYNGRCAISGIDLRNGNGRSEVQAAHIRPVHQQGPDIVQNGLALSGTLHWMFDRGLFSIGQNYEILVSENKVPSDVRCRLISPTGTLHLPASQRDYPHQSFLTYHRENIFGAAA
ncbi:MAG: HNH endonuclease [Rhodobacteraceae bacterium]|nr:HNH endonuclease [Paracoccaceae bacterium]